MYEVVDAYIVHREFALHESASNTAFRLQVMETNKSLGLPTC